MEQSVEWKWEYEDSVLVGRSHSQAPTDKP